MVENRYLYIERRTSMKRIVYKKLLLRLAVMLAKWAPEECITCITVSKTQRIYRPAPELSITHFDPNVSSDITERIGRSSEIEDGVTVTTTYFGMPISHLLEAEREAGA